MVVIKNRYTGAVLKEIDADTLYRADLSGADLSEANLYRANLYRADLSEANLYMANLYRADLSEANLYRANLSEANLSGANLSGANLSGANLSGADLSGANLDPLQIAKLSIVPEAGEFTAWKKCCGGVIVKLLIPEDAKRSNATGRKCRASHAKVLEVIGADVGVSQHDGKTEYRVSETVVCDKWGEDRWVECSGGIHFFITRIEAENY